jgi:DNA-binding PadR family transcriptional regulator
MTDAELAILSLLAEAPSYDHDINKLIDERGLRRWTAIGASSMYYVLDKLEKQGLVKSRTETDGRRKFEISPAGTGVLQTAVVDLLSTPHAHDRGFELGLVNLHVLKSSQVRSALLSRQQDIIMQLAKLRESLDQEITHTNAYQATALFSHRIRMLEAELGWLETFIDEWETHAIPDPVIEIEPAIIPRSRQVVLPQDPDSVHKQDTQAVPPHKMQTPVPKRTTKSLMLPQNRAADEGQGQDSNDSGSEK